MQTEAQIIENTLRWTSWAINGTRIGSTRYSTTAGVKQGALYSLALLQGFSMGPDVKTIDDLITHIFRGAGKKNPQMIKLVLQQVSLN